MDSPTPAPAPKDLNEALHILLQQGIHPRDIKHALRTRGIRWSYQFAGQGAREKARRRRQAGLCENGDGNQRQGGSDLCADCLAARWGVASAT